LDRENYKYICGMDEAGRGPLAGPVVTACVLFKKEQSIDGVKDSKKLSEKKREYLFDKIIESCTEFQIQIIDHKTIDEVNILNATMLGMEKCVENLTHRDFKLLIDGNYFKLRDNLHKNYDYETIVSGDDRIFEISCASILAKVTRDRLMRDFDKIYPEYLLSKHKGYGTKEHIDRIRKYGLSEIHRLTFCKKYLQLTL
jgi:ribonuclease HII